MLLGRVALMGGTNGEKSTASSTGRGPKERTRTGIFRILALGGIEMRLHIFKSYGALCCIAFLLGGGGGVGVWAWGLLCLGLGVFREGGAFKKKRTIFCSMGHGGSGELIVVGDTQSVRNFRG